MAIGKVRQLDEDASSGDLLDGEQIPGYYVYLSSGEVRKVSPADAMDISLDSVSFTWRGTAVERIPRSEVFSCSQGHPSSPMVG